MAPQVRLNGPENEPLGIVSIQEALRLAANRRRGLLVDVNLAGDEEEVVADAVEHNADEDQPDAVRHAGHAAV